MIKAVVYHNINQLHSVVRIAFKVRNDRKKKYFYELSDIGPYDAFSLADIKNSFIE
jgi:hypothetical protein